MGSDGKFERKLPEDSVMVSLAQVQQIIAEETRPPETARPEADRAVPLPVPEEFAGAVPSQAEVAARRAARWDDTGGGVPVVIVPKGRRAKHLGAAVLALGVLAGVGWTVAGAARAPADPGTVIAYAIGDYHAALEAARAAAVVQVALQEIQAKLAEAEAARATLEAERARLDAQVEALSRRPMASPSAVAAKRARRAKRAKRGRRVRRGRRPRGARSLRPRRKRRRRTTRRDRSLESLIDGL